MKIEHIALWTNQIELMKDFYCKYFNGISGEKYVNSAKNFSSYFISFNNGSRLEIMEQKVIFKSNTSKTPLLGYAHIAISLGSTLKVNELTLSLENDGYKVISRPRFTGDGYYESVILDPDGNQLELTC